MTRGIIALIPREGLNFHFSSYEYRVCYVMMKRKRKQRDRYASYLSMKNYFLGKCYASYCIVR